jgi:hypothetical protein
MVNGHPFGWLETILLGGRGAQSLTLAAILLGGYQSRPVTGAVTVKGGFTGQQPGSKTASLLSTAAGCFEASSP